MLDEENDKTRSNNQNEENGYESRNAAIEKEMFA